MKDYIGAVNDFTRAIEIEPKSSKSFTFRGSAKEALKDYTGAIDDYTKAIEIMPYNELAYVSRGVALYKQNKQNQAILDYKKVLEINPNNITANNNMGWMSIDMKEYFYATDYLSQAYRADSVNIDILLGLSLCNYLKSDTATAKNYLIKAIEVDERVKLGYSMIPLLEKEGYYYSGNQKKLLKELFGWMSTIIENTIKNDVDNKPL